MTSEDRWPHLIPNSALTVGVLPAPARPWEELTWFAGTFDGYSVCRPPVGASALLTAARADFHAGRGLPDSLTMLRTLLFFEQRAEHWDAGGGEDMPFIHALVEGIRDRVSHRHPVGVAARPHASQGEIEDRVMSAFERFVVAYANWGGYRYHGWTDAKDPHNFFGPLIRSERDCGLRLALELEREWPGAAHMELAISSANFANLDPDADGNGRQRVDLAVCDMSEFTEDDESQDRYRAFRHEAFIEIKWMRKGWRGQTWEFQARNTVDQIADDVAKLKRHRSLNRCAVAAMFVVDDEDYFDEHDQHDWPDNVWRLVAGPRLLRRMGLLQA